LWSARRKDKAGRHRGIDGTRYDGLGPTRGIFDLLTDEISIVVRQARPR
jgi:hypothetical protein